MAGREAPRFPDSSPEWQKKKARAHAESILALAARLAACFSAVSFPISLHRRIDACTRATLVPA